MYRLPFARQMCRVQLTQVSGQLVQVRTPQRAPIGFKQLAHIFGKQHWKSANSFSYFFLSFLFFGNVALVGGRLWLQLNQPFRRSPKVHSKRIVQQNAVRSVTAILCITLHCFEMDFPEPVKRLIPTMFIISKSIQTIHINCVFSIISMRSIISKTRKIKCHGLIECYKIAQMKSISQKVVRNRNEMYNNKYSSRSKLESTQHSQGKCISHPAVIRLDKAGRRVENGFKKYHDHNKNYAITSLRSQIYHTKSKRFSNTKYTL